MHPGIFRESPRRLLPRRPREHQAEEPGDDAGFVEAAGRRRVDAHAAAAEGHVRLARARLSVRHHQRVEAPHEPVAHVASELVRSVARVGRGGHPVPPGLLRGIVARVPHGDAVAAGQQRDRRHGLVVASSSVRVPTRTAHGRGAHGRGAHAAVNRGGRDRGVTSAAQGAQLRVQRAELLGEARHLRHRGCGRASAKFEPSGTLPRKNVCVGLLAFSPSQVTLILSD